MDTYTIVLADDHAMFREGIRKIIERIEDVHPLAVKSTMVSNYWNS